MKVASGGSVYFHFNGPNNDALVRISMRQKVWERSPYMVAHGEEHSGHTTPENVERKLTNPTALQVFTVLKELGL